MTKRFQKAEHGFIPHITLGKFDVSATESSMRSCEDSEYPAQMAFRLDSLELSGERPVPDWERGHHYVPVIPKLMLQE